MNARSAGDGRSPLGVLFANADFRRLWAAGGIANAVRWVDMLVSGLFTFSLTGSALAVSLVLMARALPMLAVGALAGALAEALDRRRLLLAGQAMQAVMACAIAILAAMGLLQPWHLFVNGLVGGLAWTNELATRRRMVAEAAGPEHIVQAVAFDTMTSSTTRMLGPVLGGLFYEAIGVTAAYAIVSVLYGCAFLLVVGVRHAGPGRGGTLSGLVGQVREAARIALAHPTLRMVLGVTLVMNICGFSYSGILPAFGAIAFAATPLEIGLLAAAEPCGALLTGLGLALRRGASPGHGMMLLGAAGFLVALLLAALSPSLPMAVLLLAIGGLGTAAFASLQTGLVMTEAPPAARSRILGLITTCIGAGPIGVMLIGTAAELTGPRAAIAGMTVLGLVGLGLVFHLTRR